MFSVCVNCYITEGSRLNFFPVSGSCLFFNFSRTSCCASICKIITILNLFPEIIQDDWFFSFLFPVFHHEIRVKCVTHQIVLLQCFCGTLQRATIKWVITACENKGQGRSSSNKDDPSTNHDAETSFLGLHSRRWSVVSWCDEELLFINGFNITCYKIHDDDPQWHVKLIFPYFK